MRAMCVCVYACKREGERKREREKRESEKEEIDEGEGQRRNIYRSISGASLLIRSFLFFANVAVFSVRSQPHVL